MNTITFKSMHPWPYMEWGEQQGKFSSPLNIFKAVFCHMIFEIFSYYRYQNIVWMQLLRHGKWGTFLATWEAFLAYFSWCAKTPANGGVPLSILYLAQNFLHTTMYASHQTINLRERFTIKCHTFYWRFNDCKIVKSWE